MGMERDVQFFRWEMGQLHAGKSSKEHYRVGENKLQPHSFSEEARAGRASEELAELGT